MKCMILRAFLIQINLKLQLKTKKNARKQKESNNEVKPFVMGLALHPNLHQKTDWELDFKKCAGIRWILSSGKRSRVHFTCNRAILLMIGCRPILNYHWQRMISDIRTR